MFSFPRKAPEGAVLRDDLDAITHLELWLTYQRHWCCHKPSVTVYVKEEEWPAVGTWVWEHFDEVSGVSFLPYDGGTYRQAPYEEIDEKTFNEASEKMPKEIDWESFFEDDDAVQGVQSLACVGGVCEI